MAEQAVMSGPVASEEQKEMLELENKKKEAKQVRKNKVAALTRKMNKMSGLMSNPANLEQVKEDLQGYTEALEEFNGLHKRYQKLLSEDECVTDTEQWYEPKRIHIEEFKTRADEWTKSCPVVVATPTEKEDVISPKDSISSVSRGSKSSTSSSSSARLVAQAERAALFAKAATMKERHALEEKEQLLAKERGEIRRKVKALKFEAELSATNAKLAVYAGAEEQVASTPADGMNAYFEERNLELVDIDTLQLAHTTNMLEERIVRPKDGTKHVPLFQASSRQGELGDHIGRWLLQETPEAIGPAQRSQSALNLQADHATQGGNAVLKPIKEKSINHSDKVELSTEYRPLVDDLVISQAGPMLSEQEQVRSM